MMILFIGLFLASPAISATREVALSGKGLPFVTFNITVRAGSAHDPQRKEGLAELTARLMREGGVASVRTGGPTLPPRTREQIEEDLFPRGAEIGADVGREQTSWRVTVSDRDALVVGDLLAQILVAPAFDSTELERIRGEMVEEVGSRFPREDQEEVGKAALERARYGVLHPYAHIEAGTVAGLKAITLEDVKNFWSTRYNREAIIVGLAGSYSSQLKARLKSRLGALAAKAVTPLPVIPERAARREPELFLVKGEYPAVGVHLGHPIAFRRGDVEFPALYTAATAFGKHRSFVGRLMKQVRELRGLNYGAYSYVEEFPGGGHNLHEPTQAARTRQAFTVWGRPTSLDNGCFLLRQLHGEVESLSRSGGGLTEAEFELGKSHLSGSIPLLGMALARRLGYAIDGVFYGISGDPLVWLRRGVDKLTRNRVNALLRSVIHPQALSIVVTTPDPERFKREILSERCDIHYPAGIEKDATHRQEDERIAKHRVPLRPENIRIINAADLVRGFTPEK
jgi:zinc protease